VLVEEYTDAALAGDRRRAAELALDYATTSPGVVPVVLDLLAPSQRLVGERWLDEECSVGAEHAATFVTENVLASLSVGLEPAEHRGTIVVVCAEGEWHGVPARMATELLIADGWRVVDLGPATPADQLRAYLAGVEADAVGVSVTMTGNLAGAARTVDVARRLGLPTVCGGAAFDAGGRRARAIGASGQCLDLTAGLDLDTTCREHPPPVDLDSEWAYLDFERDRVVRDALTLLTAPARRPGRRVDPSWAAHLAAELDDVLDVVVAAMLCGDPTIVDEHRDWLGRRALAAGRGDDPAQWFDALAAVIDDVSTGAAGLLA
jgi:methanogenic corrinoid protein MtbC1